jgi:hypothetical protein
LRHESLPNSFCLGPRSFERPADLISLEANRIPFVSQDIDLDSWSDSLRAWPNPPEGWVAWYTRIAKSYQGLWATLGIADALSLSISSLEKDENLLRTIGYFWSDALNCFLFGHGPMTPTLLDVVMITGLNIASPSPCAYALSDVPYKLSSKAECTNWGSYMRQHNKVKGTVTEKEHTAFLNMWLEHFLFCGPSLAPTKNYLPLAYDLAKGNTIGLGKLFLGETYRYLHIKTTTLLTHRKLRTGGPWWFIQLWARLYFRDSFPDFPSLAGASFPDEAGKPSRSTSYGQALYSLPGTKLSPEDAVSCFSVFFHGMDTPLFFPWLEPEAFENPLLFKINDLANDELTLNQYSIMLRPCFLPVGMSTSNRIIKPGYESYQPVVAARQLGLCQVPPRFFLHQLTQSRADLPDLLLSQRCYGLFEGLTLPVPAHLSFTFTADGFAVWWGMWKTHVFRKALGPMLRQIHAKYEIPAIEVILMSFIGCSLVFFFFLYISLLTSLLSCRHKMVLNP